jgi:DNA-binding transcriptional regulator YiaG
MGYFVHPDGRIEAATVEEAVELARHLSGQAPAPKRAYAKRTVASMPSNGGAPKTSVLRSAHDGVQVPRTAETLTGADLVAYRQRWKIAQNKAATLMGFSNSGWVSQAESNAKGPLPPRMAAWLRVQIKAEKEGTGPSPVRQGAIP